MPAQLPFHLINAFAPTPHGGNQAAVVIFPRDDPRATDEDYMQTVAADFNLAETAYLVARSDDEVPEYGLRWFTPADEVPLCGHATLASAYALFNHVHPQAKTLTFHTRWRGQLTAHREGGEGQGMRIGLSLPLSDLAPGVDSGAAEVVARAAGLTADDIVDVATMDFGGPSALVQIKAGVDLGALKVNEQMLLPELSNMVIITQVLGKGDDAVRIASRVFAPGLDVLEDPVTGSAHATLVGYYLTGAGRDAITPHIPAGANTEGVTLEARQLSKRGGGLTCTLRDGMAYVIGRGWRYGSGTLEVLE